MSDSLHRQEFWFQNSWFESRTSSLCLHSSVVRLDLKDLHSWKVSKAIIYRTKKIGVGIFGNLTNRFHFDSWDHESIQNKCMSILRSKSILLTLFLTSGSEKDISTSSHQLRSVQERYPSENKTRQDCTKISLSCDAPLTSRPPQAAWQSQRRKWWRIIWMFVDKLHLFYCYWRQFWTCIYLWVTVLQSLVLDWCLIRHRHSEHSNQEGGETNR